MCTYRPVASSDKETTNHTWIFCKHTYILWASSSGTMHASTFLHFSISTTHPRHPTHFSLLPPLLLFIYFIVFKSVGDPTRGGEKKKTMEETMQKKKWGHNNWAFLTSLLAIWKVQKGLLLSHTQNYLTVFKKQK
jgi:hypothetical protein